MDKNDYIWKTFVDYRTLISTESKDLGLDIFGTDQITTMAINLTQASAVNELKNEIKALFSAEGELKRGC